MAHHPLSYAHILPAAVTAILLTNEAILVFMQNRSKALPVKGNVYLQLPTLSLKVDWLLVLVQSWYWHWYGLKSLLSTSLVWHIAYLSSLVDMQSGSSNNVAHTVPVLCGPTVECGAHYLSCGALCGALSALADVGLHMTRAGLPSLVCLVSLVWATAVCPQSFLQLQYSARWESCLK